MDIAIVILAALAAALAAWVVAMRRSDAVHAQLRNDHERAGGALRDELAVAMHHAVAATREQAAAERDAAIAAALEQSAVLHREQVAATTQHAQLSAASDLDQRKGLIDARLDQVQTEVRAGLEKLSQVVASLGQSSAEKFGQVENSLQAHMQVAATLAESTQSLRAALSNQQARGQWGERMAEDVLRLAGFRENVNYTKQTQLDGASGRPDYTFPMPKGHALYMDVKFPMAAYLRYLEAGTDAERDAHRKRFLSDVRLRVRELAQREYATSGSTPSVDYVLLFIPNEQLTGFIHEHDPTLLDDAMGQKVVLCSPLTLFAFLGVIRQAFDNFMIEQTSDEILTLMGAFDAQWRKYNEQVDKVKKRFDAVDREFEALVGTRRRQLERPLLQLEGLRAQRGLPVDGQLFPTDSDDDETPPGTLRALGA